MQKNQTKQAIIYCRVSSDEQNKEGFSLDAQLKLTREYTKKIGVPIFDEFIETCSARHKGRPRFNKMLKTLDKISKSRNSPPTVLIVEKVDRLFRNYFDLWKIEQTGIEIHFVKDGQIYSQESRSTDKLMIGIKAVIAKSFSDNLSEEAKKGMAEKASQGMWPSEAPTGYLNTLGPNGKKIIVKDPVQAPIIKRLFELYASGNYSQTEIAATAKQLGLVNPKTGRPMADKHYQHPKKSHVHWRFYMEQNLPQRDL